MDMDSNKKYITLLCFGAAREAIGSHELKLEINDMPFRELKDLLLQKYSRLHTLKSFAFAQNQKYIHDDLIMVEQNAVIALLPPVSGG